MKLGFSPFAAPAGDIYPFGGLFDKALNLARHNVRDCDAILLWGGTDINPCFYKDIPHPYNGYYSNNPRDIAEWQWMHDAKDAGIPIIGVCRGAQFICAFAGGKLIQHVSGHGCAHDVTLQNGKVYQTSSSHHQMMSPFNLPKDEYEIKAWATERLSHCYEAQTPDEQRVPEVEPEVVLFPKIRALAIQGHPEWQAVNEPFVEWCVSEIEALMRKEI